MKIISAVLTTLLLLLALPARAGTIAIYRVATTGAELTFEVGDNGNFRSTIKGQTRYLLAVGDETYVVECGRATRVADYAVWMRERNSPTPKQKELPFDLTESGTAIVQGRSGRAYYPDFGNGPVRERLAWVISDDPALRPLGQAFSRHYFAGLQLGESAMPFSAEAMAKFIAPMATGTPLIAFIHFELVSVDFRAITPDRLAVPATIETLNQLRARLNG